MVAGLSLSMQRISLSCWCTKSTLGQLTWSRSRNKIEKIDTKCSKIFASLHSKTESVRVFVLSDLHTDYVENMTWVKRMSSSSYQDDILLVAGDVAETYDKFFLTMSLLKNKFKHVFFVPGNHDLWCRREGEEFLDSLDKLNALLHACDELGVESNPLIIDDLGIIPLFSWYHESFDKEQDITGVRIPSLEMVNISQELCPEKRMLFYPKLPKMIGSDFLEARLRSIHGAEGNEAACHVFGHTHFGWDAIVDGIRYVQAPLAYPRERKRRMNGSEDWLPFCLYSDGRFTDRHQFYWSEYYSINSRNPDDLQLAPWVAKFYKRRVS
ncbi:uncharacterized protein LOC130823707 isoform X2 [Amaranthus tricolor]|uniref:uncharacterized protein LOC130823707 isoform X2 n=1 Tax=Amaranthus tricolor TaxID=29722 RepID=UPI00258F7B35|nr:uncharacterized protein LOC130823707 isoform X2 [Amaranthus tricolor]